MKENIMIMVFSDVILCSSVDRHPCFRDTYGLNFPPLWKWRQHIWLHKISQKFGEIISDAASMSLHAYCKFYWVVVSKYKQCFSQLLKQLMSTPAFKPHTSSTSLEFKTTWKLQYHKRQCPTQSVSKSEAMTLISTVLKHTESTHSSVGIVTHCKLDSPGFKPGGGGRVSWPTQTALRPT